MKLSAPAPSRCTLIVLQNSSILIHISQIPEENRQDGELLAQPFLLSPERYTNRHHIEEAKTRRTEVKARSSNNPQSAKKDHTQRRGTAFRIFLVQILPMAGIGASFHDTTGLTFSPLVNLNLKLLQALPGRNGKVFMSVEH
jgi:hypothetical protein